MWLAGLFSGSAWVLSKSIRNVGALDPVVVRLVGFLGAVPGQVDLPDVRLLDFLEQRGRRPPGSGASSRPPAGRGGSRPARASAPRRGARRGPYPRGSRGGRPRGCWGSRPPDAPSCTAPRRAMPRARARSPPRRGGPGNRGRAAPRSRRSSSAGRPRGRGGVAAMSLPSSTVTLTETWCPSTLQPQRPLVEGSPKTHQWYFSGSRRPESSFSWTFRTASSPMMIRAFSIPDLLRAVASRARADFCCSGFIWPRVSPLAPLGDPVPVLADGVVECEPGRLRLIRGEAGQERLGRARP
jgi:hypothetical protein